MPAPVSTYNVKTQQYDVPPHIEAQQKREADKAKAAADAQAKIAAEEAERKRQAEAARAAAAAKAVAAQQEITRKMADPYQQLASQYAMERANIGRSPALQALEQGMNMQQGPSAAQAMLAQQADEIGRQQLGAAYARGSANPAAVRAAMMGGAMARSQAGGQAAVMRAQEDAQFRAEQQAARAQYAQAFLGQQAQLAQQQMGALGGYATALGSSLGVETQERMLMAQQEQARQAFAYQQQLDAQNAEVQRQLAQMGYTFQKGQSDRQFQRDVSMGILSGIFGAGAAYLGRK